MADRIDALKHLHTRMHDSIDGYETAVERTESPYLKGVMQDMIQRRRTDMARVHSSLNQEGIEVSHDGSALAGIHRAFLSLKDAVTGSGDEAVLNEIVRGEETLLDAYDKALEATGAGDAEYPWLREQYEGLQAKIAEFRNRAQAA